MREFMNGWSRFMIGVFAVIGIVSIFIRDAHVYSVSNEVEKTAVIAYSDVKYGEHYEFGDIIIAVDWRDF